MADLNIEIAASLGRFEREMAKVEARLTKMANGIEKSAGSQLKRVDASAAQTAANLNRMVGQMDKAEGSSRKFGGSLQQVGFQVGDFATQVGAGTSATQALGQQLPQLLGAFGTFGALAGAAAAVMIPLGSALVKTAFDSETLEERMKALSATTDAYTQALEAASTPLADLEARYGSLAGEIQNLNQVQLAYAAAANTIALKSFGKGVVKEFGGAAKDRQVMPDVGFFGSIGMGSSPMMAATAVVSEYERAVQRVRKEYKLAEPEARAFVDAAAALSDTTAPKAQEAAIRAMMKALSDGVGGMEKAAEAFGGEKGIWGQLREAHEAALKQIENRNQDLLNKYDQHTQEMKRLSGELADAEAERAKALKEGTPDQVAQWDRVIAKIREMVYETRAAASETDTLFERMTKGAQGFLDRAGKFAKGYVSSEGFESRYIEERARGAGSKNEEAVRAATAAAEQLGVAAKDLLAVMSFESGIDPSRRGGAGGKYLGLIQFSPENQRRYGVSADQSVAQQMGAVVKYLKDTGVKPGMGIEHIYAAILAGDARRINASDRKNGGIVDNVYADTRGTKFAPHINRAEGLLAAYPDVVQATNESLKEQDRLEKESAANLKREVKERERKAEAEQKARQALSESLVSQQKAAELERQRADQIAAINAGPGSDAEKAAAIAQVNAEMQRQITIMALMEEAKRRQVDIDTLMVGSTMTYRQAIEALGETAKQRIIADQQMQASAQSLAEAQAFANQQMQTLQDGFIDAIIAGESFADVLKNVAAQMATAWAQAALFGNGPFASQGGGGLFAGLFKDGGLLSQVFGGFRASGGPVSSGRAYVVGERGPEIIVPRAPGQVIPNHKLGGGGGSMSMVIDLRGTTGDDALDRKMQAAGARILAQAKAQAPGWVADNQKRTG